MGPFLKSYRIETRFPVAKRLRPEASYYSIFLSKNPLVFLMVSVATVAAVPHSTLFQQPYTLGTGAILPATVTTTGLGTVNTVSDPISFRSV